MEKRILQKAGVLCILIFLTIIFLIPLGFTIYYAMLPLEDFGKVVPLSHFTLENFYTLITKYNVLVWTKNTIIITFFLVTGGLTVNVMAGYALGSMEFPGKKIIWALILGSMMIPFQCVLTPIYIQVSKSGWADRLISCIVPFLMNSLYIFIAKQYFCTFPKAVKEAALVDGLGEFGVFTQIVLPNSKQIIVTLIILSFTGAWNSYLIPSTFLTSSDKFPLAVGIKTVKDYMFEQRNLTLAGVIILSVPILICFLTLQKYFIRGIVTSGIKS